MSGKGKKEKFNDKDSQVEDQFSEEYTQIDKIVKRIKKGGAKINKMKINIGLKGIGKILILELLK